MFPTWDGTLLLHIQDVTQNNLLDRFFIFFTALGDYGIIWIALGLLLICFKKTRTSGILLLVSLLFTHLLNSVVLKEIINRPRPYETLPDIRRLIAEHHESSFPSGHAATAFGSGFVLMLREKNYLRWGSLVIAVLIAFSRLYVGMHYPLDVLTGSLVGIAMASFVVIGEDMIRKRKSGVNYLSYK